jgi:hypothetical protein
MYASLPTLCPLPGKTVTQIVFDIQTSRLVSQNISLAKQLNRRVQNVITLLHHAEKITRSSSSFGSKYAKRQQDEICRNGEERNDRSECSHYRKK